MWMKNRLCPRQSLFFIHMLNWPRCYLILKGISVLLYDVIALEYASNKDGGTDLKEAQPSRSIDTAEKPRAGEQVELKPQGIGMAVAFDWGVAVQVLVTPFLPLFLGST